MDESIYLKRQQNLKDTLTKKGLDGMLITNLTNIRYISGFTGLPQFTFKIILYLSIN